MAQWLRYKNCFLLCYPSEAKLFALALLSTAESSASRIVPGYDDWRRQWHPTPVLLSGESHGQRSLVGCIPWGREELDTTEQLHFHFSLSCIGEGNGNPLQCSCLENPRDGGAWWAAVYGVAQSRTRLKWLSSSSSSMMMAERIGLTILEMRFLVPYKTLLSPKAWTSAFHMEISYCKTLKNIYALPSYLEQLKIVYWYNVL